MFSSTFRRQGALALLAGAAVLLAALLIAPRAEAATIYACQKKKGGTVRIVTSTTKCKSSEKKIRWNQTGPAGKNGATGGTGAAGSNGAAGTNGTNGTNGINGTNGATGARGPSDAWYVFSNATGTNTKTINLSLPAGSYAVTGSGWASNNVNNTGGVTVATASCEITSPQDGSHSGYIYFPVSGVNGTYSYGSGTAHSVFVLPTAGTISLLCARSDGAATLNMYQMRLQAQQVGTLN